MKQIKLFPFSKIIGFYFGISVFLSSCQILPAVKLGISVYGVLAVGAKVVAKSSVAHLTEIGIDRIIEYFSGEKVSQNNTTVASDPLARAVDLRNAQDLKAGSIAHFNTEVTAYLSNGGRKHKGVVKIAPHHITFERVDLQAPWDFTVETKRLVNERRNMGIIQAALHALNYPEVGKIDGIVGRKTRKAIKNFQTKNGLSQTGVPDFPTMNKIYKLVNVDVRGLVQ